MAQIIDLNPTQKVPSCGYDVGQIESFEVTSAPVPGRRRRQNAAG